MLASGKPSRPVRASQSSPALRGLIYQDVDGMKKAVGALNRAIAGFDASCFDGVYVTGDITAQGIADINADRTLPAQDGDCGRLALPNAQEA